MVSLTRRKHAVYIIVNGFVSIVSLIIVCTAMGTEDWIRAEGHPKIEGPLWSDVNYGLFRGSLLRRPVYTALYYDIYFSCVWSENSCAWSCIENEELRKNEVENLIAGKKLGFACIPKLNTANLAGISRQISERNSTEAPTFTNAGLWLSTIIFHIILIISLIASIGLSIINCIKSPVETYINVQGIYLTNSFAIVANFFVLLLYAILYEINIKKDIAIFDTIVGDYSSNAKLGFSYWILIPTCVFHGVGIFLIAMREKILRSDRAETKIDVAAETPATGVLF